MSRNRMLYILVALALLVTGGFTYNGAIDTAALTSQVRAVTKWIEENQSALNPADASLGTAPESLPLSQRERINRWDQLDASLGIAPQSSPDPNISPDNFIVVPNAVGTTGADLSDYYQRHPGSSISIDAGASDWFQRHPEVNAANAVDLSDYFQRHRDSFNPANASQGTAPQSSPDSYLSPDAIDWLVRHPEMLDATDWFRQHPEWVNAANATDLSDYFQRHPTVMTLSDTTGAIDYIQRHPQSTNAEYAGSSDEQDDWATAGIATVERFPGKEKDDLFVGLTK